MVAGPLLKVPSQGVIEAKVSCSQFLCLEELLKAITLLPGDSEGLGKDAPSDTLPDGHSEP